MILNFQIRLLNRIDGGWGTVDENGNWNGMVSNLHNAEANIAVAELTLCCRRTDVADLLWTIDHPNLVFAIKS